MLGLNNPFTNLFLLTSNGTSKFQIVCFHLQQVLRLSRIHGTTKRCVCLFFVDFAYLCIFRSTALKRTSPQLHLSCSRPLTLSRHAALQQKKPRTRFASAEMTSLKKTKKPWTSLNPTFLLDCFLFLLRFGRLVFVNCSYHPGGGWLVPCFFTPK